MKKIIVFLLTALLMFSVAFADSVPMSKEDQMASLVKNFLEENEFPYEYDDYTFTVPFSVDNSMEYAFITVYIYDDMLSVSVDAPIHGTREVFEKMAVFTTLVNNEIYYAQFRLDLDGDEFYAAPATWWRMFSPVRTSCSTCSPCRTAIWKITATASWRY